MLQQDFQNFSGAINFPPSGACVTLTVREEHVFHERATRNPWEQILIKRGHSGTTAVNQPELKSLDCMAFGESCVWILIPKGQQAAHLTCHGVLFHPGKVTAQSPLGAHPPTKRSDCVPGRGRVSRAEQRGPVPCKPGLLGVPCTATRSSVWGPRNRAVELSPSPGLVPQWKCILGDQRKAVSAPGTAQSWR